MSTTDDNSCSSTQINLQHVFKTFAFGTHAYFEACAPLVNRRVDCALFNAVSDFCQMLSQVLFAIYGNHGPWYCHLFMSKEITGEHVILEQFIGHTDSWTLLCFLCNRIFGDFLKKTTWLALHICITLSCIASIYAQPHTYAKYQNLSKFIARPTSAKQVMFSPVFVCLSVNRIIQKLLIKSLCFANGWT